MPKNESFLRRAFDTIEEPLRKRVEALAATEEYGRTLYLAFGAWSAASRVTRSASTSLLHLVNLPAHADLRRLARQLGALEAKIDAVSAEVERVARRLQTNSHSQTRKRRSSK